MPLKKKLKTVNGNEANDSDSSSASGNDQDNSSMSDCSDASQQDESFDPNEEIMIDFEARDIQDRDLTSINALILQKLSPFQSLNTLEMAKYIVEQENKIGNVIYQGESDPDEQEPTLGNEQETVVDDDTIFGVLSLIDLGSEKSQKIATSLKTFLAKEGQKGEKKTATQNTSELGKLNDLLASNKVAYVINERFINIPPAISVPMYESLIKDLSENKTEFDYWFFLAKIFSSDGSDDKIYANPEEQVFEEFAECRFEVSLNCETICEKF
jgi:protein BCP1